MIPTNDIYYVDTGQQTTYFTIADDNTIIAPMGRVTMPRARFIDFINTARVLGLKAGKL